MGSLFKADVIRLAKEQVGYIGGKGTSKFSHDLDVCNYWNMPPKDGCPDADWCSIFFNWLIYMSTRNSSGEIDPDVWDAHYFTFEPDSGENLAAGCGYAADYYMQHDAWSGTSQGACVGDQIFFRNFAHTGLVCDWDDEYIYTIEGNTRVDGEPYHVAYKKYRLDDPDIDGYGHPRYDGDEYEGGDDSDDDVQPEPDPADDLPQSVSIDMDIIQIGDKGNQVETLQILLNAFGYSDQDGNKLAVDSIFGSRTDYAVKAFQENHDIENDGIVGFQTWTALLK